MKRYPEYKVSDAEWVGEIPVHWKMKRAKFIFRRLQRPVRENDEITTAFRDGIVTLRKNRRTLGFTNSLKEIGYQGLRKGDLVIHAMDGHAGAIGVSDSDGKSSPVYSVCRPISQENVYYYAYLLRYMALSGFIESLAKGIRERSTEFRFNEFKELDLLIPPVFEQTQIANFLDRKTGQIDELIRIKERRIELLQEQRTALINQAVTKGLDPNVEMKPSGVEWIGEIPKHWRVKRLKYISRIVASYVDKHINPDEIQVDLCNYTDVYYHEKIDSSIDFMRGSCNQDEYERSLIKKGDIIITKDSESADDIGVPTFTQEELTNVVCGYHLSIIRPLNEVDGKFLFRFIQSKRTGRYFEVNATGITRFSLGKSIIENLSTLLPPLSEQRTIANFLDHKTQQIDELMAAERQKIELLKEYRQSLISEAVTGKIDVRSEV